jgi:hypothetical protein
MSNKRKISQGVANIGKPAAKQSQLIVNVRWLQDMRKRQKNVNDPGKSRGIGQVPGKHWLYEVPNMNEHDDALVPYTLCFAERTGFRGRMPVLDASGAQDPVSAGWQRFELGRVCCVCLLARTSFGVGSGVLCLPLRPTQLWRLHRS